MIAVILISLVSFATGFIVAKQREREPLRIEYYENGKLMHEYAISGTLKGGDFRVGIGDRSDGVNADAIIGMVDEVRIYNRALSEAEVIRNMNEPGSAVNPSDKLAGTWAKIKTSK